MLYIHRLHIHMHVLYISMMSTVWWASLAGGNLVNLLFSSIGKKSWVNNRSAKRLLIVSAYLDGFSLANHG